MMARLAAGSPKVNASRVSASIHPTEKDFHLHLVELQASGAPDALTLASFFFQCLPSPTFRRCRASYSPSSRRVFTRIRSMPFSKLWGSNE